MGTRPLKILKTKFDFKVDSVPNTSFLKTRFRKSTHKRKLQRDCNRPRLLTELKALLSALHVARVLHPSIKL
jgi:hypothetical protein